ncbi:MAG TPA: glutamate-cysteine ligase family protein [Gemmatimonadales bacterium]
MTNLPLDRLTEDLARVAFAGAAGDSPRLQRIGAEVELIPIEALTGRRCSIEDEGKTSTLPLLRRFGGRVGWREGTTAKGTPCFAVPGGGAVTFEPGGQLEYSSPACFTGSSLLANLRSIIFPLQDAAAGEGIELLAGGIDPFNSIDHAPLLIRAKRYQLMADYFATIGPAGAQMMRQTASFQVNLDFPDQPWLAWRVLNAMAPFVSAILANSPLYQRRPAGFQSSRAAVWRAVDPQRTGIAYDRANPIEAYCRFALDAPVMLFPMVNGRYRTCAEWLETADLSQEDWHEHLSTLFPEVRPRGHLELRSADTVPPQWFAVPIALLAGVLYNSEALYAADALLGSPDSDLLDRAARWGLHDPGLRSTATDLFEVALQGCRALGPAYLHPSDLEQAEAFFDQYTRRGRALADDVLEDAVAA